MFFHVMEEKFHGSLAAAAMILRSMDGGQLSMASKDDGQAGRKHTVGKRNK